MGSKMLGGALLVLLLILPAIVLVVAIAMNRPMLLEPPGFAKRLSIYWRYNVAETTQDPLLPELRIRRYRVSEETMKKAIERTIRSLPRWEMIRAERDVGAYQVAVTSRLWRFRDDLSVLATGTPTGEIEVYVHSASRLGRGDLGANRVHVLLFYETLERYLRENP